MEALAQELGETSVLGVRVRDAITYIAEVEAPQWVRYVAPIGVSRPLHCTAVGRAILGAMPADESAALLKRMDRPKLTDRTRVDIKRLFAELEVVREQGWAVSAGESIAGVVGIAAPIGGAGPLQAALGIAAPESRLPDDRFDEVGRIVLASAQTVSRQLRGAAQNS